MTTASSLHIMLREGREEPLEFQVDTDSFGDPLDGHTRISFTIYGDGLNQFSITGDRQAVVATIRDLWDALYAAYPCVGVADQESDPDDREVGYERTTEIVR